MQDQVVEGQAEIEQNIQEEIQPTDSPVCTLISVLGGV